MLILAVSQLAFAKDRVWQDATVYSITSSQESGSAIMPMGTMMVGVPIRMVTLYYSIRVGDMSYILACNSRKRLDVTLHGRTKIALDGSKWAHIQDDNGKDVKILLVQKIQGSASNPDSKQ